jgi:electron transport complex protein RnfA
MKELLLSLCSAAFYAVFMQNIVFTGGFGASEVTAAVRSKKGLLRIWALVCGASLLTAIAQVLLVVLYPAIKTRNTALQVAFLMGCTLLLYLITGLVLHLVQAKAWLQVLPPAILNTLVLAVPLLNYRLGESIPRAIATGLGAGIAFGLAAFLVRVGLHVLEKNEHIPQPFRGLPATLLYTGLLAMAFSGFTGAELFA